MRRKTIQLGGRTLLISIPHQWAAEHNITKGSDLIITETPEGLLVQTDEVTPRKECVHINSQDMGKLLRRTVLAAYTDGANRVIVTHKPSEMNSLRELTKEFIGFDILSQDKNKTVFQDFSTRDEKNVQQVFQRALMILKTMFSEGREGLQRYNPKTFATVEQLDVNLNRTCNYCYRYSRKNILPIQEAILLQLITHGLEKSGDIYKEIIFLAIEEKDKTINNIHEHIEKLLETICSFTLKRTAQHAIDCANAYDKLKKAISGTTPTKTTLLISQLLSTLIDIQANQLVMIEEIKKE